MLPVTQQKPIEDVRRREFIATAHVLSSLAVLSREYAPLSRNSNPAGSLTRCSAQLHSRRHTASHGP
jgi:hypothetical protein